MNIRQRNNWLLPIFILIIIISQIVLYKWIQNLIQESESKSNSINLEEFVPPIHINSLTEPMPDCRRGSPGEGWFCSYVSGQILEIPANIKTQLESLCRENGGESETGPIMPMGGAYFSCFIPFSDYGKPCTYSFQCKGECEYTANIPKYCIGFNNNYFCFGNVYGTCSKEEFDNCDIWSEVKGRIIVKYNKLCLYDY